MSDTRRSAAEPSGRVCESRSESVRFIADFCCLEHRLKIELDGGQHACEVEKEKDEARTDFSEKTGDTRCCAFGTMRCSRRPNLCCKGLRTCWRRATPNERTQRHALVRICSA